MKNLENYGVQELNAREIRETDGGGFWEMLTDGTSSSGTNNPIAFAGEAVYNGLVMFTNFASEAWFALGTGGLSSY